MPTLPVTLFMVKLLSIHLKMQLAINTDLDINPSEPSASRQEQPVRQQAGSFVFVPTIAGSQPASQPANKGAVGGETLPARRSWRSISAAADCFSGT